MAEDEVVKEHPRLHGCEFAQALRGSRGQRGWRAAVHGAAKHWTRLSD